MGGVVLIEKKSTTLQGDSCTCVRKRSRVLPKDAGGKAACTAGSKSKESSFHASSISRMLEEPQVLGGGGVTRC